MKILHLIAGDLSGGAARGAYWLHRAQREIGVESSVITDSRSVLNDRFVHSVGHDSFKHFSARVLNKIANTPTLLYPKRKRIIFNTGFSGIDISKTTQYKQCDLVHLHWINGLISIKGIGDIKKPIVWTLRDMWPLTGGCHYAMECENYTAGCGQCPQLGSNSVKDLSRYVMLQKQLHFPRNMTLVGISEWLSNCARTSAAFTSQRITTISNNLDVDAFRAKPKPIARQELGLELDKRYILLGAQNIKDFYKGFDLLMGCLMHLKGSDYYLLTFGNADEAVIGAAGLPFRNFGFLHDNKSLSTLYSAADVFIAPSRMEAFGKTLVESMACRTPVVCFDATGPKDIVDHKVNGYKATAFEPIELAKGVEWIMNQDEAAYEAICFSAETRARTVFDSQVIAQQYKSLYEEILNQPT